MRIEVALDQPVSFGSGDEPTLGIARYDVNPRGVPGYLDYLVGPSHPPGMMMQGLPGQVEEPGAPAADPDAQDAKSTPAAGVAWSAVTLGRASQIAGDHRDHQEMDR